MQSVLKNQKSNGNRKQKILDEIRNQKTPDDIVAVMLSFLKKENIPANFKTIHSSVAILREKHPHLLNRFTFSSTDIYPFSRLLERVFFRLQNSGMISTVNPDFKVCIISKESKNYIKKNILPIFSDDEINEIKKMSSEFEKIIFEKSIQ